MKKILATIVVVLILVSMALGQDSASAPTTRPHDPWVFRAVLDKEARMLVVALGDDLWIAYDTQSATLKKAWRDGVQLTGGVYDGRHGPQPRSKGLLAFAHMPGPGWIGPTSVRYLGYDVKLTESVMLHYSIRLNDHDITVDETPSRIVQDGKTMLSRQFDVKGMREGESFSIVLPPAQDGTTHFLTAGDAAMEIGLARPPRLTFSKDGSATVVTQLGRIEEPKEKKPS